MTTVTKSHLEIALTNLRREAVACGLMGEDETLTYEKGSRVNGVTAMLWVGSRGHHAPFVPRFTLRNTQREQILMIEAASYSLFTLRMHNMAKESR
jgi:hypothetical protein